MKIIKKYIKIYKNLKKKLKYNKKKEFFKKFNKIKKLIDLYKEYKENKNLIKKTKKLIKFKEIKILIDEDLKKYKNNLIKIKKKIKNLIKKNNSIRNFFIEIKSGVGGEESAIFIKDISKMYIKYFEKKNILFEIINLNKTNLGGYKDILIFIKNSNIFKKIKNESGVHRVQRKPITENQEKIHTSTCKVLVFKDFNKKIKINYKDLKIETFKASGSGGQHVNKTESAIRIKHIPSGLKVECQDERSQNDNKKKALILIKNKIFLKELIDEKNKNLKEKNFLTGKGDRSEKIRTYNYQKNLIIDHRVNIKLNNLNYIMNGNIEKLLSILKKKL